MLQDSCQRASTNAKMRWLRFAAFRDCIALEQRRLLMQPDAGYRPRRDANRIRKLEESLHVRLAESGDAAGRSVQREFLHPVQGRGLRRGGVTCGNAARGLRVR